MSNVYKERLTTAEQKEYAELGRKIVERDGRICFGIVWFESEADAQRYGELNTKLGFTVNGGWYHGAPLNRAMAKRFDQKKDGEKPLYACLC